ncbi:MAG: hypothetical protein CL915_10190 [Deltaproteobacteria bacterium]|nr:hypothetical protein [Deltaproteobacteria bacterium]
MISNKKFQKNTPQTKNLKSNLQCFSSYLIPEDKNDVSMNFLKESDQNPFSEIRILGPPISLAFLSWLLHISNSSLNAHILILKT